VGLVINRYGRQARKTAGGPTSSEKAVTAGWDITSWVVIKSPAWRSQKEKFFDSRRPELNVGRKGLIDLILSPEVTSLSMIERPNSEIC